MIAIKDETIIILQDERAIWCRWHDKKLIDRRVILHSENVTEFDLIPFDGISEIVKRFGRPITSLIIDSSLDEVDSYSVTDMRQGLLKKSNDIEHIHESLSRSCQLWLHRVQEQGLVFDRVTSTLRLLLQSYRNGKQQALIIVDDEQLSRHVLCHRGRVVYARQCSKTHEISSTEALIESLDYLNGSTLPQGIVDCNVVYVGSDQAILDLLSQQSTVPVVHETSKSAAHWYFDFFRRQRWRIGNSALNCQLNRVLNGQLDRSESHRKLHRNDQKLYLATCLTVFIASITVIVACVHGFTVARYMRGVEAHTASLSREIITARQTATEIHRFPIRAAKSLAQLELFDRIEKLDAATVLTLVADVVTLHPGIKLDRLEWLLTDNEEALQWIGVASLKNAPVPISIQQVLKQSLHESKPVRLKTGTQIAIEGSVQEATLRGKKTVFDDFINALEATPNIASVKVVTSPMEHATSSEMNGSDFQFSLQLFHWPS